MRVNIRYLLHKNEIIYCELHHQGRKLSFSTSIKCEKNKWFPKSQTSQEANINQALSLISNRIFELSQEAKTLEGLRFAYLGKKQSPTLLEVYEDFRDFKKLRVGSNTARRYQYVLNLLKGFLEYRKCLNVQISEIDNHFARDFEAWLLQKKYRSASIKRHTQALKAVLEYAKEREYIKNSPISRFTFSVKSKGNPALVYLEVDQIQVFEDSIFENPIYDKVRDMFLFQVYTGFAHIEMHNFDYERDTYIKQGTTYISLERQKTGSHTLLPLFDKAHALLKKYNYQLPKLRNDHYNRYLREISQLLGIKQKVTSHVARKTAGCYWLNSGVSIEVVARMLGHQNIAVTQKIYAKVNTSRINKETQHLQNTKKPVSEGLAAWKQA